VAHAAIKLPDGSVWFVERPGRHSDVLKGIIKALGESTGFGPDGLAFSEGGFLLTDGRFVDRVEAKRIALAAKQLLPGADVTLTTPLRTDEVW
jgi:hypothetical protein